MDRAENFTDPEKETTEGRVKPADSAAPAPTAVQSREPEDAYLTGGQRNLQRRVLGLNVNGSQAPLPPQSPGLHSTGSFTGVATGATEREPEKPKS